MAGRRKQLLVDPSWEEMVEREPLLAFSFYLSGRVNVLLDIADQIVEHLDQGFADDTVYANRIGQASALM